MNIKHACANCHFFVRHYHGDRGVEHTFAIEIEQREKAIRGDLSWQRDSESIACSRGIWDEGLGMSDSAKITAISKQERHNKCYYFDYQPGMLLPAAEKLQQEKSTAVSNIFKSSTPQVAEVFFSYAHEDEDLMNDVRRQMIIYERNGTIVKWYDRMIPPGAVWKELIDQRINDAPVIILMFSPSFIESRYCYEVEGQIALRRHTEGSCLVVPVILRPCAWQDSPFGEIQALPTDGKPITQWPDRDQVCLDVAQGIVSTIKARNKS